MTDPPSSTTLRRRDVYPVPVIDGRPARNGAVGRFRRGVDRLLVSGGERQEAELERRIRTQPAVTRPNTVALISPKGGVGKTTSTFLVGSLLATHLKVRVIAVDANPDLGTRRSAAPNGRSPTCWPMPRSSRPRRSSMRMCRDCRAGCTSSARHERPN